MPLSWRHLFLYLCLGRGSCQDLFLQPSLSLVPVEDNRLESGDTTTIFTINPDSALNQCLDLAQGGGISELQLWECNGLESQLWYFDSGSYQIQWGGDRTQCIDAGGSLAAGNRLMLWSCNGMEQQIWGYDTEGLTVFLAQSSTDATYCMDLSGGSFDSGTPVDIWNCNGLANQQWQLMRGITVRMSNNYKMCLDLQGQSYDNGTPIQIWNCNGLWNQKWSFSNFQLSPAWRSDKCIDSGSMQAGNRLWLWDCNSQAQQTFGFDGNSQTIYLSDSVSDASLCLDVSGGSEDAGTLVQVWSCNGCWNQMFQVVGPLTMSVSEQPLQIASDLGVESACPTPPGPGPAPPGPSPTPTPTPYVYGHCESGDDHGYSVFMTQADLQADAGWSCYVKTVYGQIPSSGYPLCIYGLFKLYMTTASGCGCNLGSPKSSCPTGNGQLYSRMSGFDDPGFGWIYNSDLMRGQSSYSVDGNKWVEVTHDAFSMDGAATWLYYTPGSSFWFWTGNTKAYNDHQDAVSDLLGETCVSKKNECGDYFADLYKAIISAGLNCVSFVKHDDMQCDESSSKEMNLAIEIIDIAGTGTKPCGGSSGWVRFKAGWEASASCYCDGSQKGLNCEGYGGKR